MSKNQPGASRDRLISLDVFRGITIAGMVLVNNPGSWGHLYWPLGHADWHGWTPTDLVFPFFLFIVGVAIPLALGPRLEAGADQSSLLLKILRRSAIIFALGLFLNGFPYFDLAEIRIPGVLQRIAVCYLVASIIFLKTKDRTHLFMTIALLVVYWFLLTRFAAPGFPAGDLSKVGSIASYIDRTVFGTHVWAAAKVYDPEGLLSTIPAIATTLFGVITGKWLRASRSAYEKVAGLFVVGALCIFIGWAWHPFFPINKSLWTSSYVFFTGGMALQFLALCYWLIDIKQYRRWARPFVIFGVNAIALFVGSGSMARLLGLIKLEGLDGTEITLKAWLYRNLFATWASPLNASLMFAIAFLLVWLGLMWLLYRKKIFLKV